MEENPYKAPASPDAPERPPENPDRLQVQDVLAMGLVAAVLVAAVLSAILYAMSAFRGLDEALSN